MTKAYSTVSNEALCVINGIKPINIKTEETGKYYDITKGKGMKYDMKMAVKYWKHRAKHIKIFEGHEDSSHSIQAFTDGSNSDIGVGSEWQFSQTII